jgi:biotin carboxyl carrier protein
MRKFVINVNGKSYEVEVEEVQDGVSVTPIAAPVVSAAPAPAAQAAPAVKPAAAPAQAKPAAAPQPSGAMGAVKMNAPMPGSIIDVKVNVGDSIKKDQVILILEAMKMENEIMAPQDGRIASVNVTKGSTVNSGDLLVTLE